MTYPSLDGYAQSKRTSCLKRNIGTQVSNTVAEMSGARYAQRQTANQPCDKTLYPLKD